MRDDDVWDSLLLEQFTRAEVLFTVALLENNEIGLIKRSGHLIDVECLHIRYLVYRSIDVAVSGVIERDAVAELCLLDEILRNDIAHAAERIEVN